MQFIASTRSWTFHSDVSVLKISLANSISEFRITPKNTVFLSNGSVTENMVEPANDDFVLRGTTPKPSTRVISHLLNQKGRLPLQITRIHHVRKYLRFGGTQYNKFTKKGRQRGRRPRSILHLFSLFLDSPSLFFTSDYAHYLLYVLEVPSDPKTSSPASPGTYHSIKFYSSLGRA